MSRFGRPITEGNHIVDRFDEWCVRQYRRLADDRSRVHDYPYLPRDEEGEDEVFAHITPAKDPELYDIEVRR